MIMTQAIVFLGVVSASAVDRTPTELAHAFVSRVSEQSHIPGLAVGVVKNGESVFAEGYGSLAHGTQQPVGPHSLFQIGSCTKTFIAMGLAHFVALESSDVTWETNVHDITKGKFNASVSYLTRNINIGDLLAHRTGYGDHSGDLVWGLGGVVSERELVEQRVPFLEPTKSLRETFMYSNIGYEIATITLEVLAGEPWYAFVNRTFLVPLGMSETFLGLPDLKKYGMKSNLAYGHFGTFGPGYAKESEPSIASFDLLDSSTPSIFPGFDDGYFGAGSAVSSVTDFCKWMLYLLEKASTINAVAQSESAQMIVPHKWASLFMGLPLNDTGNAFGAGFGFDVVGKVFHGQRFFTKGGDTLFHKARTGFLPESGVAAVVLSSMEGSTSELVCSGIRNAVLEIFTGVNISVVEDNWAKVQKHIDAVEEQFENSKAILTTIPLRYGQNVTIAVKNGSALTLPQMEQVFHATQTSGLPPPEPVQSYVGEFHSAYGGRLHVTSTNDGRLSAHYGAVHGLLSFYEVVPSAGAHVFLCPNASLHTAMFGSLAQMIFMNTTATWQLGDMAFSRDRISVGGASAGEPKRTNFRSPYLPFLANGLDAFLPMRTIMVETNKHRLHEPIIV